MEEETINVEEVLESKIEENLKENSTEENSGEENLNEENLTEENLFDTIKSANRKLADENEKLTNELEAMKDKLLRLSAEYENFRKRSAKEKEGIYTDVVVDVIKETLPVVDNLERALSTGGTVDDLKVGVELTLSQFKVSLNKLGVEEIETSNGFDPNFHNAVMHVTDETLDENSVVEVFQKGFMRNEKVLRHSMVKVAN